ncbi:hypothetical protein MMC11_001986 [Xylographa trunciseda]|nr:hypothetical protein [Xylographa trunciseda]
MDYFQPGASFYWDAYVSPSQPSRAPARNVTTSLSFPTTTTGTIVEDENGDEYYECTPPSPSPSHQVPSTPSCAASHISWQPATEVRRSRRGPYGQYNQHFVEAERRDLELTRQRHERMQMARKNSVERLCQKVNDVVSKAVKKPWKKILGKIKGKSQSEVGGGPDAFLDLTRSQWFKSAAVGGLE